MRIEFQTTIYEGNVLDWLFPARNKQSIKRDLRKHLGSTYYNLSLKMKLELIKYWKKVILNEYDGI